MWGPGLKATRLHRMRVPLGFCPSSLRACFSLGTCSLCWESKFYRYLGSSLYDGSPNGSRSFLRKSDRGTISGSVKLLATNGDVPESRGCGSLCFFFNQPYPHQRGRSRLLVFFWMSLFFKPAFYFNGGIKSLFFFMDVSQTCGGGRSLGLFLRCFPKLAICVNYCNSAVMLKTTNSLTTVSPPNRAE